MNVPHILLGATILLAPNVHAEGSEHNKWEQIADSDGITVYQKTGDSPVISLRGETTIPAHLSDIFEIMKNNATAHEWIPMVKERRDLKQISDKERIEFTHIEMPWPMSDRYFINKAQADYMPNGKLRIFVQSIETPDEAWLEHDKVLGVMHYSEFILTPLGGKTHMVIEVNSDPKGLIPKFLVNAAQRSWPRKFFTGLTDMLRKTSKISPHDTVAH